MTASWWCSSAHQVPFTGGDGRSAGSHGATTNTCSSPSTNTKSFKCECGCRDAAQSCSTQHQKQSAPKSWCWITATVKLTSDLVDTKCQESSESCLAFTFRGWRRLTINGRPPLGSAGAVYTLSCNETVTALIPAVVSVTIHP